ncbi:hypothetical protein QOT17_010905 [Balamuthia mandrillaris]
MDVSREEEEWTQVEEEVEEEEAAATHRRAGGGEEEGEEEEEEQTVICKVVLGGKRFYLRTWWQADCFDLTLSDARHVWSGAASKEYIEGTLKPPEMPLAEYMRLTRQALTSQDLTKKRFSYKLSASSTVPGDVEFTWRIRLQESAISFSMKGTLPLRRVKDGQAEIQQFFDWFLQRQNLIEKENKQLRQRNERLHAQKEEANTHLNALVEEKVALEQELYKKFVVILNEKKRRIRELKAELTTRPTQIDAPPVTKPKDKKAAASKLQLSSEGGEEEEEASENEARSNGENNKHTFSLTGPTPSFSLLEDETNYNIRTTVRKRYVPLPSN